MRVWMAAQELLTTYMFEGKNTVPETQNYRFDDFLQVGNRMCVCGYMFRF